jgi:hypothetical protein
MCGDGSASVCVCGQFPSIINTNVPSQDEMMIIIRSAYSVLDMVYKDIEKGRIDAALIGVGCTVGSLHNFLKQYDYPVFGDETE